MTVSTECAAALLSFRYPSILQMPEKCSCRDLHVIATIFVLYFFTLAWSVTSSVFFSFSGSFSSILFTFSQKNALFNVFGFLEYFFNFSIVVLRTKLNPVIIC